MEKAVKTVDNRAKIRPLDREIKICPFHNISAVSLNLIFSVSRKSNGSSCLPDLREKFNRIRALQDLVVFHLEHNLRGLAVPDRHISIIIITKTDPYNPFHLFGTVPGICLRVNLRHRKTRRIINGHTVRDSDRISNGFLFSVLIIYTSAVNVRFGSGIAASAISEQIFLRIQFQITVWIIISDTPGG